MFIAAWRSWKNAKSVALLAALALAIGIGSGTAIYTVVNAVMLRPLPYANADRFTVLLSAAINDPEHYGSVRFKDAQIYQQRTRAFDLIGWFRESNFNLTFSGHPEHVLGLAVSLPLAQNLGVSPRMGQWFTDTRGVVVSNSLWRKLGSDVSIVGKTLTLDGRTFTVTGVMPEWFRLPVAGIASPRSRIEAWVALDPQHPEEPDPGYFLYARRKPGISFAAAEADTRRIAAEIRAADPINHPGYTSRLFDLRETVVRNVRPTLLLLLGAAALLFLITCANAAGLLLARSVARARETAIRVAMGAKRSQLSAQYFLESLIVALGGAAGGILLSLALVPAIVSMAVDYLPRAAEIEVDWSVLLFALAAALIATALSSLAPLWQASKIQPAAVLGDGVRSSASARSQRVSHSLVIAEIALSFALLAVSTVLVLHLRGLAVTSPGLDPNHLLTFKISLPEPVAADGRKRVGFQHEILKAIRTIPGVNDVAFTNQLPIEGCCMGVSIYPEGRSPDLGFQRTSLQLISPDYARTLRIPVLAGRFLTERDTNDKLAFVVVSRRAATLFWGVPNPVGAYGRFENPNGGRFQVLGVVGDVKNDGLANPPVPDIYLLSYVTKVNPMSFVVRSPRSEASLLPDIRRVVAGFSAELPIHDVGTMTGVIRQSTTLERAGSLMTSFFAVSALLMAMLGVYGVVSYSVRQRTIEIGTRMAIGATNRAILSLVVASGLRMAAWGMVAGAILALASAFWLTRLFAVTQPRPVAFLYSALIVAAMAIVSSFLPAWRAALLSPMVAIRNESESIWRAARTRVAGALSNLASDNEPAAVPLGPLISEFAGGIRRAESSSGAIDSALAALREQVSARSVMLLDPAANPYLVNRLKHHPHAIPLTADDFETLLRWSRELRPQYLAELEQLRHRGVAMVAALRTRNDIVGILALGAPSTAERYTPVEAHVVGAAAEILALIVENSRLTSRELEQEKLRRDLALAAEVQRRLLPPKPPGNSTATLAAFSLAARTIGGDYYDFLDLGSEGTGICVADVAGKGIAAALVMSVVQASLRAISAERDLPLSQLAEKMNGFLYGSTGSDKYATFFYAQLRSCGQLRYVNAGHNPPYLVRVTGAEKEVIELPAGGTVIGLFPKSEWESAQLDLRPGDLLVAFTDGVPEALNEEGEEFGEDRLKALLCEAVRAPAEEVSARLAAGMREWIGKAEQYDDLTFVVVSLTEPAHATAALS